MIINKRLKLYIIAFLIFIISPLFLIGSAAAYDIKPFDDNAVISVQELHKTTPPTPQYNSQSLLSKAVGGLGGLLTRLGGVIIDAKETIIDAVAPTVKTAAGLITYVAQITTDGPVTSGAIELANQVVTNMTNFVVAKVDNSYDKNMSYQLDPYGINNIPLNAPLNIQGPMEERPGSLLEGQPGSMDSNIGALPGAYNYTVNVGGVANEGFAPTGSTIPRTDISDSGGGIFPEPYCGSGGCVGVGGFLVPSVNIKGDNVTISFPNGALPGTITPQRTVTFDLNIPFEGPEYIPFEGPMPEESDSFSFPIFERNNDYLWIPSVITPGVTPPTVEPDPFTIFLQDQCKSPTQ